MLWERKEDRNREGQKDRKTDRHTHGLRNTVRVDPVTEIDKEIKKKQKCETNGKEDA